MIVSYDARFLLIVSSFLSLFCEAGSFHHVNFVNRVRHQFKLTAHNGGLSDLLNGKSLFITGVADTKGYGWGIAKQCAAMGARVFVGTWVPMVKIFEKKLHRGDYDEERKLDDGTLFDIARVYPIDVAYDTCHDIPTDVRNSERYRDFNHYSIQEVADQIHQEHGMIDGIVHCIANAPDINKSLLQTSRAGYLAVMSISAYSFISMVSKFATIMNPG
jgi:enoyl-[acyl-carrier protein] reductase I